MPLFDRVTIVGLGLIGGSLGMAIRRVRLAREVVGVSRTPSTSLLAKEGGAIDLIATTPARAVRDADLVILATPVETIIPCAKQVARSMRPGSILTDVGSCKQDIVHTLERQLPHHVSFVGAHPLAGSERRGIQAANPRLFEGSLCIVTKTARTNPRAAQVIKRLWAPLVRRVLVMTPERHDRLLAAVSHLPHLIAFCLTRAAPDDSLAIAPRSFLEVTRIAKSDPDLWDDIFLSNRAALLQAMARFDQQWRTVRGLIVRSQRASLRRQLARANSIRDALKDFEG